MDIRIILSADEKALEFSRNLGKVLGAYISQSDIEAGLCGKFTEGITATLEPDTMPWEDEVEKGRRYAEEAQKAAEVNAQKAIEKHDQEVKEAQKRPTSVSVTSSASDTPPADVKIPTLADLKAKAAEIGKRFSRDKFFELKAAMGVESMQALDDAQRLAFGNYLDEFLANN